MKSTENVLENIPTRQLEQKCKDKLRNYKFYNIKNKRNKQTNNNNNNTIVKQYWQYVPALKMQKR